MKKSCREPERDEKYRFLKLILRKGYRNTMNDLRKKRCCCEADGVAEKHQVVVSSSYGT